MKRDGSKMYRVDNFTDRWCEGKYFDSFHPPFSFGRSILPAGATKKISRVFQKRKFSKKREKWKKKIKEMEIFFVWMYYAVLQPKY
jgi:hypothetical protein